MRVIFAACSLIALLNGPLAIAAAPAAKPSTPKAIPPINIPIGATLNAMAMSHFPAQAIDGQVLLLKVTQITLPSQQQITGQNCTVEIKYNAPVNKTPQIKTQQLHCFGKRSHPLTANILINDNMVIEPFAANGTFFYWKRGQKLSLEILNNINLTPL